MSPREPIPTRTSSRLRSRPRACALTTSAHNPRRAVACSDVDGAPHVARWARGPEGARPMPLPSPAWSGALGDPTPLAVLLAADLRAWELDAPERVAVAVELAVWPLPVWSPPPVSRYVGRRNVEPPPLRQVGVAGDLAAALSTLADVPRWVDPAEALDRVRAVIETQGTTRAQMLAAMATTNRRVDP